MHGARNTRIILTLSKDHSPTTVLLKTILRTLIGKEILFLLNLLLIV